VRLRGHEPDRLRRRRPILRRPVGPAVPSGSSRRGRRDPRARRAPGGLALLELYGVPRPKERVVDSPEAAGAAARAVGFPVAVKALAPELPHKARLGGVRLGLAAALDAEVAAAEVLEAATRAGARRPRVLVQRMVSGAEVLVGAVVDPRFGA